MRYRRIGDAGDAPMGCVAAFACQYANPSHKSLWHFSTHVCSVHQRRPRLKELAWPFYPCLGAGLQAQLQVIQTPSVTTCIRLASCYWYVAWCPCMRLVTCSSCFVNMMHSTWSAIRPANIDFHESLQMTWLLTVHAPFRPGLMANVEHQSCHSVNGDLIMIQWEYVCEDWRWPLPSKPSQAWNGR